MGCLDPGDVARLEDRREGLYFLELIPHGVQVLFLQDPGEGGGVVGIVGEGVPAAEDEVVHSGQGDEVLYLRDPVLGALAEAYGPQLRQGTHRPGETLLYELDARDEGRRHRSHTRHQNAQSTVGLPYLPCLRHTFPTFQSVVLVHNLDGAHGGRGWLSCVCRSMAREELPLGPTGPPDR